MKSFRIALNGGHMPGVDSGAVGRYSTEAAICRRVMEKAAAILRDFGGETMTVQSDDLAAVCRAADGFSPAAFVSIHCNGATSPAATGTEAYAMSRDGRLLAGQLVAAVTAVLETIDRGVKDGGRLYVVKNTAAPAVLLELAFITNPQDEEKLLARTDDAAAAIATGIRNWLEES